MSAIKFFCSLLKRGTGLICRKALQIVDDENLGGVV